MSHALDTFTPTPEAAAGYESCQHERVSWRTEAAEEVRGEPDNWDTPMPADSQWAPLVLAAAQRADRLISDTPTTRETPC